jgi:hypothetical protein
VSPNQRRMNAAHRERSRSHSTAATPIAATKWEKYTQLAIVSYQWISPGS